MTPLADKQFARFAVLKMRRIGLRSSGSKTNTKPASYLPGATRTALRAYTLSTPQH